MADSLAVLLGLDVHSGGVICRVDVDVESVGPLVDLQLILSGEFWGAESASLPTCQKNS